MKRFFICPVNDGEAVEIRNILSDHGERVVATRQPWGATWLGLEAGVVTEVEGLLDEHSETEVIGIELGGQARWNGRNIDHHRYAGDDRSNPKSSLEQVADLLGIELTRHQILVAENDKGWIPGMERVGASPDEIKIVRAQDRLSQGVNPEQEAQAVRDLEGAEWKNRKVLIRCPKGATSALTDRLYGQFDEAITIDGLSGKWIYYGSRHQKFFDLTNGQVEGAHWIGGGVASGYAGAEKPKAEIQPTILDFFWNE